MTQAIRAGGTGAGDRVAGPALGVLAVVALVCGGGPQGQGDLAVHLAALPCLAVGVSRWSWARASRMQRAIALWWLAAIAIVALQLVPLPASVFAQLPHRAGIAADLQSAGIAAQARPMSLDPWGTLRALLALVTTGAAWLTASTLTHESRMRVLAVTLAAAAVIALLGFAQAAAGEHSPLRLYAYHHPVGAIGTFANRNHFATLLGMLLPVALAFGVHAQRARRLPAALRWYALALGLLLASALSYSRAGFALTVVLALASLGVLTLQGQGRARWVMPALVAGTAALAVGTYAWDGLMQRLAQDPLADLRWQYLQYGAEAARAWLPWGSGLGSFQWVYAPFEPVHDMVGVYASRAHNDVLQVAIEAGIPGLLLVLAFVTLVTLSALRTFPMAVTERLPHDPRSSVIAIAIWGPLLHSLVDYPLRTLAVAVVVGLLLACLQGRKPRVASQGGSAGSGLPGTSHAC